MSDTELDSDYDPTKQDEQRESDESEDAHQTDDEVVVELTQEQEASKRAKMDLIWKDMNDPITSNRQRVALGASFISSTSQKPHKVYEFAGQTFHEHSVSSSQQTTSLVASGATAARPFLEERLAKIAAKYGIKTNDAPTRLTTYAKSKMDWNAYVEREGIQDELKLKNKDGYVEKMKFLTQVDERQMHHISKLTKKRK